MIFLQDLVATVSRKESRKTGPRERGLEWEWQGGGKGGNRAANGLGWWKVEMVNHSVRSDGEQ